MAETIEGLLNGLTLAGLLVVMLVGLFGLVIPIFPGGVVIWLASLAYGIIYGFTGWGMAIFAVLTLLMIAGALADNVMMGASARQRGASWAAIILGLLAGVIGTIVFPPFGGLIGAPAVLFGVEFLRLGDTVEALRITKGLVIGWGKAFVVRFGLGVIMIVLWGVWVWVNAA
jgi:uncharacterized protein YqgC (DUF456 family)